MKKLIALFLVLTLALSFAACGKQEPVEETTDEVVEDVVEESTEESEESISVDELPDDMGLGDVLGEDFSVELPVMSPDGYILDGDTGNLIDPVTGEVVGNDLTGEMYGDAETPTDITETLVVLQNIWTQYGEDEKFAIMGGNPEAGVMDAPGVYDMTYAENLGFQLVIPAEQMANVTEAATMIHMMNANTFSCGAVKLTDGTDAAAFAQAVRDALQGNQWICGFPETMVIANIGGVVLIAFGVNDAMTPFMANLAEAYADAQILFNEAITG